MCPESEKHELSHPGPRPVAQLIVQNQTCTIINSRDNVQDCSYTYVQNKDRCVKARGLGGGGCTTARGVGVFGLVDEVSCRGEESVLVV